jgi:hypothetical protein
MTCDLREFQTFPIWQVPKFHPRSVRLSLFYRIYQLFINIFSYNKLVNSTFSHSLSAKRIVQDLIKLLWYW